MNKKILIGSIIAVVILVLVSFPITIGEKIYPKIEPLDNGEVEIFSKIRGYCVRYICKEEGYIIYRQIRIYGEMDIKAHTFNSSESVYYATAYQYVYAPIFIGLFYQIALPCLQVFGYAFGNIEWS